MLHLSKHSKNNHRKHRPESHSSSIPSRSSLAPTNRTTLLGSTSPSQYISRSEIFGDIDASLRPKSVRQGGPLGLGLGGGLLSSGGENTLPRGIALQTYEPEIGSLNAQEAEAEAAYMNGYGAGLAAGYEDIALEAAAQQQPFQPLFKNHLGEFVNNLLLGPGSVTPLDPRLFGDETPLRSPLARQQPPLINLNGALRSPILGDLQQEGRCLSPRSPIINPNRSPRRSSLFPQDPILQARNPFASPLNRQPLSPPAPNRSPPHSPLRSPLHPPLRSPLLSSPNPRTTGFIPLMSGALPDGSSGGNLGSRSGITRLQNGNYHAPYVEDYESEVDEIERAFREMELREYYDATFGLGNYLFGPGSDGGGGRGGEDNRSLGGRRF